MADNEPNPEDFQEFLRRMLSNQGGGDIDPEALRALLDRMRQERCYSAYYLPCRWRSTRLVYAMAEAKRAGSPLYGKLDWAGYYLLGGRWLRS